MDVFLAYLCKFIIKISFIFIFQNDNNIYDMRNNWEGLYFDIFNHIYPLWIINVIDYFNVVKIL